jgi:hypothetical protein
MWTHLQQHRQQLTEKSLHNPFLRSMYEKQIRRMVSDGIKCMTETATAISNALAEMDQDHQAYCERNPFRRSLQLLDHRPPHTYVSSSWPGDRVCRSSFTGT